MLFRFWVFPDCTFLDISIQSEKSNRQCYHERNRYMVLSSDRVIAVYDGRSTGGTFYTIRFAQANEKEIRIIEI